MNAVAVSRLMVKCTRKVVEEFPDIRVYLEVDLLDFLDQHAEIAEIICNNPLGVAAALSGSSSPFAVEPDQFVAVFLTLTNRPMVPKLGEIAEISGLVDELSTVKSLVWSRMFSCTEQYCSARNYPYRVFDSFA
jgi:hypothetical protein